jgi:hypothetical protein
LVVPDVVGAEVHHYDVGFGRGEPAGKQVLVGDVDREVAALF